MEARIEGVHFAYGDRPVLDVPDLRFEAGRVTALLGPNGSGKSTLLRLLAGLERPRSGRVLIGGKPAPRARSSVAYAFQEAVFLSGSLRANLDLALRLRGLAPDERRSRLAEAAGACGVVHLLDRPANRLSGGEAQRANLARALALRAPLTLLDEPLAGFDERGRGQMLEELPALLRRFAGTAVLVTHDRDEALRLAADLVLLREGCVRAAGPKREVFASPPDPDTAELLGYTILGDRRRPCGHRPRRTPARPRRLRSAPAPGGRSRRHRDRRRGDWAQRRQAYRRPLPPRPAPSRPRRAGFGERAHGDGRVLYGSRA